MSADRFSRRELLTFGVGVAGTAFGYLAGAALTGAEATAFDRRLTDTQSQLAATQVLVKATGQDEAVDRSSINDVAAFALETEKRLRVVEKGR